MDRNDLRRLVRAAKIIAELAWQYEHKDIADALLKHASRREREDVAYAGETLEGIWHTWLREAEEKLEPRCCECGKNVYDGKDNERCERATAVATSLSALMRATALRPVGKKPTASVLRLSAPANVPAVTFLNTVTAHPVCLGTVTVRP
jgi:hypothetical protein